MWQKQSKIWGIVMVIILTVSCSSPMEKELKKLLPEVKKSIETLNKKLDKDSLVNAKILKEYASKLDKSHPEYNSVTKGFLNETEPDNERIKDMKKRLEEIDEQPRRFRSSRERLSELITLSNASDHEIYNDSLIDSINTMADLSEGTLPRLQESKTKSNSDAVSRLVGNPNYGRWENRGGQSVWVWLAAYSVFNNLTTPYYYHRWYYGRPWSYYNDYGYSMYAGRSTRRNTERTHASNERKLKEYGRSRGRNYSSYNSKKTNSSFKGSAATRTAHKKTISSGRNRSSYSASHRSSSRSRSSSFRGK